MSTAPLSPQPSGMFQEPPAERAFPWTAVGIATVAVLILAALFLPLVHQRRGPSNAVQPLAPYAANLALTDITMSESTSLSGGKSTYIDGNITNNGDKTVTGVMVQTLFANDEKLPPQVETSPLMLIRTRQPYVDTEMVSADPLPPGAKREFRLTFEAIGANWNQQLPEIHAVSVGTR